MRRGKRGYSSKLMSKQILRESLAVRRLLEVNPSDLKDNVIAINRVTKVVKGGKNLSFSALVVVGDSHGHAGFGMGKAREVPMAIKKGIEQAKKNLIKLNLKGSTIPHQVLGRYGSAQVLLKPAGEGTGVIAGGPVRKVMQVAGITNVLTKSIGTSNPHNVVKAMFAALLGLKDAAQVAETRSKTVEEISGKTAKEKAAVGRGTQDPAKESRRKKLRQRKDKVGSQLHWLHRRHAPDHSRSRSAKIASSGGAPGHAGGARHDSQGASPRGSGGVGAWRKRQQAVRASAAGTSRRARHRKSSALSRSRTCIRLRVRASAKSAWAAASAPSSARPRAPATKGNSPVAAIRAVADLKAARCRCTAAFRSAASTIRLASRIRW